MLESPDASHDNMIDAWRKWFSSHSALRMLKPEIMVAFKRIRSILLMFKLVCAAPKKTAARKMDAAAYQKQ